MPDVECRVGKGSADGDQGVQNKMRGAKPGQGAQMGIEECLSSEAAHPQ